MNDYKPTPKDIEQLKRIVVLAWIAVEEMSEGEKELGTEAQKLDAYFAKEISEDLWENIEMQVYDEQSKERADGKV